METNQALRIATKLISQREPFTVGLNDGTTIPCHLMISTKSNLVGGTVLEALSGQRLVEIDFSDIRDIGVDVPSNT